MAKGMSIHIGVNAPSPPAYAGYDGLPLLGCENDAAAMAKIADDSHFRVIEPLLGPDAKADVVLGRIAEAAKSLDDGDTFLLTFAGHGSVIDSTDLQEEPVDQTWVLFDRMLIDDELYACWTTFNPGVRIVVVSDSCFSGTIISLLEQRFAGIREFADEIEAASPSRVRALPREVAAAAQAANAQMYAAIQKAAAASRNKPIKASVLLLAACEDWLMALDGSPNGVFTAAILNSYDKKDPPDYESLYDRAYRAMMVQSQEPKWMRLGVPNIDLWHSSAFSF